MKTCIVTHLDIDAFWKDKLEETNKPNLLVFGTNGLGVVSYKQELEGLTEYFQDVAKLSRAIDGVIISGCNTDTYGVLRHSAVIADRGKILGVSDMIHCVDESEYVPGGYFRVYDTSAGKIGVIIGEDLFFPEVSRILTLCDADILVCVFDAVETDMPEIMVRSSAFANGVTVLLCAKNVVTCVDIRGNVIYKSDKYINQITVRPEKDYHLISSRRRGIYKDFSSGY